MISQIFTYLKHKKLTEVRTVDKLFVSAFVLLCNVKVKKNKLIESLLIHEGDEEFDALHEFISKFQLFYSEGITIEDMVTLFEFVVSPSDRIVTGAVYTPCEVRKRIIDSCLGTMTIEQLMHIRVADIACGCGGFLIDVASYLHRKTQRSFSEIYRENIYGIDIQSYSVKRTKILLSLLALTQNNDEYFHFNILQADTLDFNTEGWNKDYSNFNVVVGNPPYVCSRNVSEETKTKMLYYEVCQSGHPDLYIPFFQIATNMLLKGGTLGFITMNSFIRSVNGRAVREYFSQRNHDIYIVDFRGCQIFRGKSTYTCLFFLIKGGKSGILHYSVNEIGEIHHLPQYIDIPYKKLDNKKGWALNGFTEVSRMESVGIPIAKYCQSRHGIATLSNKTYIFKPIAEDDYFYYLKEGDNYFSIEKEICRNVVNSNKLNSDVLFESIVEKLIYPYHIKNGTASIIDESSMKKAYPCTYKYLMNQRERLDKRDKGKTGHYPTWYAYGRTQSLVMPRYKLFYPKFANKSLRCVLRDDVDLMLYNGVAFVSNDIEQLQIMKCVLDSDIFWNYVIKNAKPYASGYYSLSGVDIKNFGIPKFESDEKRELLSIKSQKEINEWLDLYYD